MKAQSCGCMSFQAQFRLDKDVFSNMSPDPNGVEVWYNSEDDCMALFAKPYPFSCLPFGKQNHWCFIGHMIFEKDSGGMRLSDTSSKNLSRFMEELGLDEISYSTELSMLYKREEVVVLLFMR